MPPLIDAAAWLVAIFCITHNLWAIGCIRWSLCWLRRKRQNRSKEKPSKSIVILLPMFQEQSHVSAALRYFSTLDYPSNLYRLVVVTTDREERMSGDTTAEIVRKLLKKDDFSNILHFNADGNDRCKADQLNQAVEWLNLSGAAWWTPETIVGVYDADSRPEHGSLLDVAHTAMINRDAKLFQQPAMYLSNYDSLPRFLLGAYLRSRPLYNFRFCLYRELPAFYRSVSRERRSNNIVRALMRSPNHLLGHGEFVRLDALMSVRGFPPPSGDTSLGTILSYKGEAVFPLSTFDIGESPASIRMLILQGATWYAGCSLYIRDLQMALNSYTRISPVHALMSFKRWLENMIWCIGPMLWVLATTYALFSDQDRLLASCLVGFCLHAASLALTIRGFLEFSPSIHIKELNDVLDVKDFVGPIFIYPVMLLGTCLGPIFHYCLKIWSFLFRRPLPRWKTNRNSS